MLNYNNLCLKPEKEIDKLIKFLNLNVSEAKQKKLTQLVKLPKSFDRYKDQDISFFREDQLEFVKDMGFPIE